MTGSFEILWAVVAERDLLGIVDFIADDDPGAALEILHRIRAGTARGEERICHFSHRWTPTCRRPLAGKAPEVIRHELPGGRNAALRGKSRTASPSSSLPPH